MRAIQFVNWTLSRTSTALPPTPSAAPQRPADAARAGSSHAASTHNPNPIRVGSASQASLRQRPVSRHSCQAAQGSAASQNVMAMILRRTAIDMAIPAAAARRLVGRAWSSANQKIASSKARLVKTSMRRKNE